MSEKVGTLGTCFEARQCDMKQRVIWETSKAFVPVPHLHFDS